MAEETHDQVTQAALDEENNLLASMARQYLESRVVELNIKLRESEAHVKDLELRLKELKEATASE